ncbi:MAG: HIT domain-containing protein, partial [Methanocorpusculum sp.]|nr:HIT domain-containing protein [Methanocorpusculum sp.]
IVPKTHISFTTEINESNSLYVAKVYEAVAKIAKEQKLEKGFRVVNNCGEHGGQTVNHLHFHLLARRYLQWPPG